MVNFDIQQATHGSTQQAEHGRQQIRQQIVVVQNAMTPMTIRAMIPAESPTASSTVSLALTKLLEPSLTLTFLGERLLVSPLNLKP